MLFGYTTCFYYHGYPYAEGRRCSIRVSAQQFCGRIELSPTRVSEQKKRQLHTPVETQIVSSPPSHIDQKM